MSSTSMEGWLLKKKSNSLFKGENHRWFRIQEVKGAELAELALCYYYSQRDKEAKGWVYLKDITELVDNVKTFSVVSAARTLILEAKTTGEHSLWLQTLSSLCPSADSSTVRNIRSWSQSKSEPQAKETAEYGKLSSNALKQLGADPKVGAQLDRSSSLFSRHAQGEKESLYVHSDSRYMPTSDELEADRIAPRSSGNSTRSANSSEGASSRSNRGAGRGCSAGDSRTRRSDDGSRERGDRADRRYDDTRQARPRPREHSYDEEHRHGSRDRTPERNREKRREPHSHEDYQSSHQRDRPDYHSDDRTKRKDQRSNRYNHGSDSNSTISGRLQKHINDHDPSLEEVQLNTDQTNRRAKEKLRAIRGNHRNNYNSDSNRNIGSASHASQDSYSSDEEREAELSSEEEISADNDAKEEINLQSTTDDLRRVQDRPRASTEVRTVEEFLAVKAEHKAVDSDEDERADAKQPQQQFIQQQLQHKPKSKPPRPPQSQPPPYASISTLQQHTSLSTQPQSGLRMGTPPRPAGNPGTIVDPNFATADWDDDESNEIDSAHESKPTQKLLSAAGSGVQADPNWLDEDFDS